jgi:beta-lactamase class A
MKFPNPALTRRSVFTGALLAVPAAGLFGSALVSAAAAATPDPAALLAALEKREGGRLGVTILDTATGQSYGHRADELFALCSTFKFVLAAAILQRVDAGSISLDHAIAVTKADIVPNSGETEKHVGKTMSVGDLCHATITQSDNAAANLLLKEYGGPEFVTAFLRGLGDTVTRLDRFEPHMNNADVANGDTRDTTSPAAMAATMQAIVLGEVLTPASRQTMAGWLKATVTGPDRLRRFLPEGWIIGHKTGTGEDGPTNDIAVLWPPGRAALVVTVYYDRKGRTMKENATVLAEVGRIAAGG